jgi:hypothetical protein
MYDINAQWYRFTVTTTAKVTVTATAPPANQYNYGINLTFTRLSTSF